MRDHAPAIVAAGQNAGQTITGETAELLVPLFALWGI
jgi:hypothetical protein